MSRFRFRPFQNGDPPSLVDLWNRGLPERGAARPLAAHEFDALVMGKLQFDRQGLVVAERDGRPVGFAHAGFGPAEPQGPSHRLDPEMGTLAMLVVDPSLLDDAELGRGLIVEAERYLLSRGATVFYAGGCVPLNPFYWGLYGGSEFSGVVSGHVTFRKAVESAGYRPSATTVLLEADLSCWREPREPKSAFLRRQTRLEVLEDTLLPRWWDALALDPLRPTGFRLVSKADGSLLASAWTWDMAWFGRDGKTRAGLVDMEVEPDHRRKGYGRHLIGEILRHARSQLIEVVSLQTGETNAPALALYESIGFAKVDTSLLYRLPSEQGSRPPGTPA